MREYYDTIKKDISCSIYIDIENVYCCMRKDYRTICVEWF